MSSSTLRLFSLAFPLSLLPCAARELPVIRDPSDIPSTPSPTEEADEIGKVSGDPYATVVRFNDVLFAPNVLREKDEDIAEHWFVYFCPAWWEPCRALLKPFALQSMEWQGRLNDGLLYNQVRFARVDCASHKPLCNQQGVESYPTVHHYYRGNFVATWAASQRNDEKRLIKFLDAQLGAVPAASAVPRKVADLRVPLSLSVSRERLVDFAVIIAVVGLNFWIVCRNPNVLRQAKPMTRVSSVTESVPKAGVERFLPEEWAARERSVEL